MELPGELAKPLLHETFEAATQPNEIAQSLVHETIDAATGATAEQNPNEDERNEPSGQYNTDPNEISLLREEAVLQSDNGFQRIRDEAVSSRQSLGIETTQSMPPLDIGRPQGDTIVNSLLIGSFSFVHNETIKICGMEFDVTFKKTDEEEFRSIQRPQIPYRSKQREEGRRFNRIWKHGFDRRVPLIICSDELENLFIVDGEARHHDILEALDSGKLKIFKDIRFGRRLAGLRMEPPIPVILLRRRSTTRMERLAISVALNTATRLDQPLGLGDVIISLGSFIEGKYFPNGKKVELDDAIPLIDQITSDTIGLQLLNQFLESNTDDKEIAKKWTLQTAPDNITTESQLDAMNTFERYKVYVRCAVGFLSCPTAYNIAFCNLDMEADNCRFDAMWNLRLFSQKRFIALEDEEKTFILFCLAARQRMWGKPGIPFTTFEHTVFLIDLLGEIYKTASRAVNKDKLGKRNVPEGVFKSAMLVNHLDEAVRDQPYIKSIFFFVVNWKQNTRKFSKRSILKEVSEDLRDWPTKRNWRRTEMKVIEWDTDFCSPISRVMHATTKSRVGTRTSTRTKKTAVKAVKGREDEDLSRNVVTSLNNHNTFEKLLDMGDEMGIAKAVKRFTKKTGRTKADSQHLHSGDEYEDEEDGSSGSGEIEELKVPLTLAMKWARRMKNDGRKTVEVGEPSTSATRKNPVEFRTSFSMPEVDSAARAMKSFVSKGNGYKNALKCFADESMWSACASKDEVEKLRIQYHDYAVFAMEVDGIDVPQETIGNSRTLYRDLLLRFYKKLTIERLYSQGFVCFNEYFRDESEETLDVYMDHYENLFNMENIKPPWKLVPPRDCNVGRYHVEFDEMSTMELGLDEKIFNSKLRTELKLGILLEDIIQDDYIKFDKLGSYPIVHEVSNEGTTPMYLHEIGRYAHSELRSKFPTKPGYQLFITGRSRFTVIVWKHSQFHDHIPWDNRAQMSKRFKKVLIHLKPYSALLISGRMLFSFMSSTAEEEKFEVKRTSAIRMMLYDEDYDDDEDGNYIVPESHNESDSEPNATLEDDELIALAQPIDSIANKERSSNEQERSSDDGEDRPEEGGNSSSEADEQESSSDDGENRSEEGWNSSSEEYSSSSSGESSHSEQREIPGHSLPSDSGNNQKSHPSIGRKGLNALRKNPDAVKRLRAELEADTSQGTATRQASSTAGEKKTNKLSQGTSTTSKKPDSSTAKGKESNKSGGVKRTISKTSTPGKSKSTREGNVPKKKPKKRT